MTWSAPTSNGGSPITGYQVLVFDAPVVAGANPTRTIDVPATPTSTVVTGLAPGSHAFEVRALNGIGTGVVSGVSNTVVIADPAPLLTARTPTIGQTNVVTNTNVTATFSLNVTGVGPATFALRRTSNNALVNAVVTYNATTRTATLNPSANLAPGVQYTVSLTGGAAAIRNAATGTPLTSSTWSFTTDGTRPTVVTTAPTATSPLAGAVGVGRNANVLTEFSEVVNGANANTVTLRRGTAAAPVGPVLGSVVTATVVNGHTVVTVDPNARLLANARYTLRLTGGIADTSGNTLVAVTRTFTTGP